MSTSCADRCERAQSDRERCSCHRCGGTRHGARAIPTVTAKAVEHGPGLDGEVTVWVIDCPHCGREHRHGAGEGHRVSHCRDASNPGYILRPPEPEPIDCAVCGRTIGRTATHYAAGPGRLTVDRILCGRHIGDTAALHPRFHPTCPVEWHDLHDHPILSGSRAAMRHVIGAGYEVRGGHIAEAGR